LYDSNQKTIYIGQKIEDISEKYFNNKIKELLEFMRIIEIENSKRKKSYHQAKQLLRRKEVIQEVTVQVEEIRRKESC
jgi:DNA mismatch repair protein MutS2